MSASLSAQPPSGPLVSILIVNFNSTDLLQDCLEALAGSTIADRLEIIVVDNASVDFDMDSLEGQYPWVTWLPQATNTTYTAGNNIAFAHSSAEYVLMLNPDTRVDPDALERAIAHMVADPGLAGLGAFLTGPDGHLQRYYRRLPTFADLPVMLFEPIFRGTARGERFLMLNELFERPTLVENPPGAFIMFRRSVVGERLLDPGYFNFVSDLELCDRLNRSGKILVFPDVRCYHQRAGAGVGTREPSDRLRLYHDLSWGIRRYFTMRSNTLGRLSVTVLLSVYWLLRVGRIALTHPTTLVRALGVAITAIGGSPPRY